MVETTTQTITVDRVSNSGNAIAQQMHAGKTIHVPAGVVGETYEVRLEDAGGYLIARLADRANEVQPRQPGIQSGPDTSSVGKDLINPGRERSHSFSVRKCPAKGRLRGTPEQEKGRTLRSQMTQRKL
jgi:hypothetical protein